MLIQKIKLTNFRNFKKKEFEFTPKVTLIVGDNATGKTNILEAIYLLSTGKSFKARLENEMINYEADIARIDGEVSSQIRTKLEVVLTNGEVQIGENPVNTKKSPRKKLLLNGVPKRLIDFAGNIKVVLFGPWDMDLVTASPSLRRRFLDSVLSQVDREYRRSIMIYEKGLRQRNKLLLRIRDEGMSRGQLMYWDKLLIKHGEYLTQKREEFLDFVNNTPDFLDRDYSLYYDKSVISVGRLKQYEEEGVAAGTTLVGPHRDDVVFKIKNQNSKIKNGVRELAPYGSRGEQRMGILWLKLAELSYIEKITNDPSAGSGQASSAGSGQGKPVLLLDDIFSELDHEHRDIVMDVCKNQQTIITTADIHNVEKIKGAEIIRI